MKIIAGLGNPGLTYAHNRHNIGFMCLTYFARAQALRFDKKQGLSRVAICEVTGNKVLLARPQTGMNLCGLAISFLVKRQNINPDDLLIIHDDLDLPMGKIRIRHGGGSGGHRGIESIISCLGDPDFLRIRIGIGRPDAQASSIKDKEAEIIAYVLSDFTPAEKKIVTQVSPEVSQAILCLLTEGLTAAMNKYN